MSELEYEKEMLVICPKCRNKTFQMSKESKFCICINVECMSKFRKEDINRMYIDAIGYSFDSNYNNKGSD